MLLPPLGAPQEKLVQASITQTEQKGLPFRFTLATDGGSPLEMLLSQRIHRRYRLEPHHLWALVDGSL